MMTPEFKAGYIQALKDLQIRIIEGNTPPEPEDLKTEHQRGWEAGYDDAIYGVDDYINEKVEELS